jgi:hypothetical protein
VRTSCYKGAIISDPPIVPGPSGWAGDDRGDVLVVVGEVFFTACTWTSTYVFGQVLYIARG